eukprot:2809942-Lingulodinium_polyedra.AAC.1
MPPSGARSAAAAISFGGAECTSSCGGCPRTWASRTWRLDASPRPTDLAINASMPWRERVRACTGLLMPARESTAARSRS